MRPGLLGSACCALLLCLALSSAPGHTGVDAYSRRTIAAVKPSSPPVIDGDLSDACWKAAPKAETFVDGDRRRVAADQTTAYLLYDDRCIYVAFHCRDSQPDRVVGRETVRDNRYDNDTGGEDTVEFVIDPFRSYRWDDQARFSVNPLGTPSARISGGRAAKTEWKGDWEAAARRVADGWDAEMRIPWAILSYPQSRGPVTMGVNFSRWQEHAKIGSIWSYLGGYGYNELEGQWTDLVVPASAFHPQVSLLPYILPHLGDAAGGLRSGLDARFPITPEMTLVGSINPDFATIEGAVEGIAFSRSERFVPERRPFFLEGRDYLGAGADYAFGPLFYSNRIGVFDIGAKAYGKVTPADTLGVLVTERFRDENNVVARYDRQITATSSAGLFFTRKGGRTDDNSVAAAVQGARWGKVGLYTQWAVSAGREAGGSAGDLNLTYDDRNNFTSVQYLDVSPLFRDANGLIYFTDYRGFSLYDSCNVQWRRGPFRAIHFDGGPQYTWHTDGRPFQRGIGGGVFLEARGDWGIGLDGGYNAFDGQIDNTYGITLINQLSNRFRRYGIRFSTGRQGSRPSSFVGPFLSVRFLRKVDLAYDGAVQNLDGVAQQHIVTLNYEVSPTRSFGGRVVVQGADTNWYLSYRHSGARGTEMFVMLGDPNAQRFTTQAALKFVFAL